MSDLLPTGLIMVVDDDSGIRNHLEKLLQQLGHQVLCAEDGRQALSAIRLNQPDVILMDLDMPGRDGFELSRLLKVDPATAAIPVIIISGLTQQEFIERGISTGAADYVTKPFDLYRIAIPVRNAILARQMRNELDGHTRAAEARAGAGTESSGHPGEQIQELLSTMSSRLEILKNALADKIEQTREDFHRRAEHLSQNAAGPAASGSNGDGPAERPALSQPGEAGEARPVALSS